jgi:hypothetical protein
VVRASPKSKRLEVGEALAPPGVTAAILATSTQPHASRAIECLQAGKHVQVDSSDEVTFLAHIRGGGLDLVQWQLPATKNQTMSEATYGRRYTDGARSAAG